MHHFRMHAPDHTGLAGLTVTLGVYGVFSRRSPERLGAARDAPERRSLQNQSFCNLADPLRLYK